MLIQFNERYYLVKSSQGGTSNQLPNQIQIQQNVSPFLLFLSLILSFVELLILIRIIAILLVSE